MAIKLGLVGIGKIARDQHLPALAQSGQFQLIATASRNAQVGGVPGVASMHDLLDRFPQIEAVSLCTPPVGRAKDARLALSHGRHVMLEKPPTATLSEAEHLVALAAEEGRSLFFSWHSRHAPQVEAAKAWLAGRTVEHVCVHWLEDIRVWHPGQEWILDPGGFGVFDPAINALSIMTAILPKPFALQTGAMTFPANRQAPIAASLLFADVDGTKVQMELDFLHAGVPRWDIEVKADGQILRLTNGGSRLFIGEREIETQSDAALLQGEYPSLYRRFAELIATGSSEADVSPLRHVADAFMLSERRTGEAFQF